MKGERTNPGMVGEDVKGKTYWELFEDSTKTLTQ